MRFWERVHRHIASFSFKTRLVFFFMVLSLFIFSVVFVLSGNGEFMYYSLVMFAFFLFIVSFYHKLRLTEPLIGGIAIHWLLSLMGGTLYFGGTRLYDLWLLPPWVKYDNVVHVFGVFILTFVAYNLLRPHFAIRSKTALLHFSLLLFLIVMGLGAVSEIMELGAVLWLGAAKTVGDYFNNAFDLVWNATGSIVACVTISMYERRTALKRLGVKRH